MNAEQPLTTTLRAALDAMGHGLVERDVPVRLVLLAAIAGEHVLLIGPPGTAKSELARRLGQVFADAPYFERLLTRFTVPEELFGPLSIQALQDDRYHRKTTGYLPEAAVAFLDEIFKANSAILNALLTLLNEREFDNGTTREKTPLVALVGASNELPADGELEALYDRFLLRCHVGPVTDAGFDKLLRLGDDREKVLDDGRRLRASDLEQVRKAAAKVAVPDSVVEMLSALRKWLVAEDIQVSDRRWRKIVRLLQVSAYTNGRDEVSVWDGWLLQHATWSHPDQRERIQEWYENRIGASSAAQPARFTKVMSAWEHRLAQDQRRQAQQQNEDGDLLYLSEDGTPVTHAEVTVPAVDKAGQPLFRTPPNLGNKRLTESQLHDHPNIPFYQVQSMVEDPKWRAHTRKKLPPKIGPARYAQSHIDSYLTQLDHHKGELVRWLDALERGLRQTDSEVEAHLWIAPGSAPVARASIEQQLEVAEALRERIEALRSGVLELPTLGASP